MTLVHGRVLLPYGPGGQSPVNGCVSFVQRSLGSWLGAIFVPATVEAEITDGVLAPVELAPGTWQVFITAQGRTHALPELLVEGEQVRLSADALPGDGTYRLELSGNQTLTHIGDGSYEIGEA
ncbi:hypothetical protein [Rothia sp. P4278]|uniref:hypothetical protein n=1 Tax=Rothia sp. P4278 TaxID=3402658 RepID=UPI003AEAE9A1